MSRARTPPTSDENRDLATEGSKPNGSDKSVNASAPLLANVTHTPRSVTQTGREKSPLPGRIVGILVAGRVSSESVSGWHVLTDAVLGGSMDDWRVVVAIDERHVHRCFGVVPSIGDAYSKGESVTLDVVFEVQWLEILVSGGGLFLRVTLGMGKGTLILSGRIFAP